MLEAEDLGCAVLNTQALEGVLPFQVVREDLVRLGVVYGCVAFGIGVFGGLLWLLACVLVGGGSEGVCSTLDRGGYLLFALLPIGVIWAGTVLADRVDQAWPLHATLGLAVLLVAAASAPAFA